MDLCLPDSRISKLLEWTGISGAFYCPCWWRFFVLFSRLLQEDKAEPIRHLKTRLDVSLVYDTSAHTSATLAAGPLQSKSAGTCLALGTHAVVVRLPGRPTAGFLMGAALIIFLRDPGHIMDRDIIDCLPVLH